MKINVTVVDRYLDGRKVRMVKVTDAIKPRRTGLAPVDDEHDSEQYEAAVVAALEKLRSKRA